MKGNIKKAWRHVLLRYVVLISLFIIAVFFINKFLGSKAVLSFKNQIGKGEPVLTVKFSSDGIFLGCGNAYGDVGMLRIKDKEFIDLNGLGGNYPIMSMDFSQNGRYYAYCESNGRVIVADINNASTIFTRETHDTASTVTFSPDGKYLALGGATTIHRGKDQIRLGVIRVWDLKAKKLLWKKYSKNTRTYIYSVAFSPDGKTIASGDSAGFIRIWSSKTGNGSGSLKQVTNAPLVAIRAVAFSSDGKYIVSVGRYLNVWDFRKRDLIRTKRLEFESKALTYLSQTDLFAFTANTTDIIICNIKNGRQEQVIHTHHGPINSISSSPSGDRIASGTRDGTIEIWPVHVKN